MAVALRHNPGDFGLELDGNGSVLLEDLISGIRKSRPAYKHVTEADIRQAMEDGDKQRYVIEGERIRAYYGHSQKFGTASAATEPPQILYHGTSPAALASIAEKGLIPMSRQFVHHSTELSTAQNVGGRHHSSPFILEVEAKKAHDDGVAFYFGNEDTWMSEAIPPQYLRNMPESKK